jgi:hypothetical protein
MADPEPEPHLLSEAELRQRMETALTEATAEVRRISEQLAAMAFEARTEYESRGGARVQWIYRLGSWSYSTLSAVVAAAVGGTVLALDRLPSWVRYAVAALSLVAAALGALRPAAYLARRGRRRDLYRSFHRWTWQYVLVDLPTAALVDARSKLDERGAVLDQIRGLPTLNSPGRRFENRTQSLESLSTGGDIKLFETPAEN